MKYRVQLFKLCVLTFNMLAASGVIYYAQYLLSSGIVFLRRTLASRYTSVANKRDVRNCRVKVHASHAGLTIFNFRFRAGSTPTLQIRLRFLVDPFFPLWPPLQWNSLLFICFYYFIFISTNSFVQFGSNFSKKRPFLFYVISALKMHVKRKEINTQ